MRRVALLGVASAVIVSLAPLPAAGAAVETEVTGRFVASSTVSVNDVILSFCPVVDQDSCQWLEMGRSGTFSASLVPDRWKVSVYASGSSPSPYSWYASAEVEILDAQDWTLQLPELSRVELRARGADGEPLAGLVPTGVSDAAPVSLAPDLPTFATRTSIRGSATGADGRSVFGLLPDSDFDLEVTGRQGSLEYRVPLRTPTRTSIDASADTVVRARALPIHTISFRVQDHAGQPAPVTGYRVSGPWGTWIGQIPDDGPAVFSYPEASADLTLASAETVWQLPSSWSIEQPLSVMESDAFTLTLPQPVRTRVTVEDSDTSDVAEGVRVQVGGQADPAVLSPGLAPARVFNGGYRGLRAISNADGGVQFRTFPDATLTTSATVQGPGLYRTAPERDVDATTSQQFAVALPKSVVIDLDARDQNGAALDSNAQLRVAREFVLPFQDGPDGRPQMRVSPGPASVEAGVGNGYWVRVKRDVVVLNDTTLEYRVPAPTVESTVVVLDENGAPLPGASVWMRGMTSIDTDAGVTKGFFGSAVSTTDQQGVAHVLSPPAGLVDIQTDAGARAEGVIVRDGGVTVLQRWTPQVGAGVPYALFDAPAAITLDREGDVSYRVVDGSPPFVGARLSRTMFGQVETSPITAWPSLHIDMTYPAGATSCARMAVSRNGEVGPYSPYVCRTRPLDDKAFDRVGPWQQVESETAQGDGFVAASQRGSRLELVGLDIPAGPRPGEVSLVTFRGPDAGSVRLRLRDEWISRVVSLSGPASGEPVVVPVPLYDGRRESALRGKLEVVVVTDGQRVRLDGLAWPIPTAPAPFLSPL